jgi:hypothetical protein
VSIEAIMRFRKTRRPAILLLAAGLLCPAPVHAQDLTLLEGFGDGFLFHWVFASGRKNNIDGSITYLNEDNAGAATLRQSPADPCVFHVNALSLKPPGAAPRKIFSLPRSVLRACASNASGDGRSSTDMSRAYLSHGRPVCHPAPD